MEKFLYFNIIVSAFNVFIIVYAYSLNFFPKKWRKKVNQDTIVGMALIFCTMLTMFSWIVYYYFKIFEPFKDYVQKALFKEDFKEFKIPKGIYLTSLNYDTGLKTSIGDKNTIIEALKSKDINNINNNKLIFTNSYDKLIKYRQFY